MPPEIRFGLGCFFSLMSAVLHPYTPKDQATGDRVKLLSRVTAMLGGGKKGVAQLEPGRNISVSTENGSCRARLGSARSFHTNISSDVASSTGGLPDAAEGPQPDQWDFPPMTASRSRGRASVTMHHFPSPDSVTW